MSESSFMTVEMTTSGNVGILTDLWCLILFKVKGAEFSEVSLCGSRERSQSGWAVSGGKVMMTHSNSV